MRLTNKLCSEICSIDIAGTPKNLKILLWIKILVPFKVLRNTKLYLSHYLWSWGINLLNGFFQVLQLKWIMSPQSDDKISFTWHTFSDSRSDRTSDNKLCSLKISTTCKYPLNLLNISKLPHLPQKRKVVS